MDEEQKQNRSFEMCRRVVTTESFIKEARQVWGDRYDYSKVDYKNREHRITVICPVHGEFQVYAREHLDGKGCPKCEKGEKFISKLKTKFGDKFGLEKFVYNDSTTPVTLICPKHGEFSRLPNVILNSTLGCPECKRDDMRLKQQGRIDKKEAEKEAKRQKYERQNQERADELRRERIARKAERDKILKSYYANPTNSDSAIPFRIYWEIVGEHIDDIRYNAKWREPFRAPFRLSDEEARELDFYREGDTFYKYPNEAPDGTIRKAFEGTFSEYGKTLEEYIERGSCIIHSVGPDLIIQEESTEHAQERYETANPKQNNNYTPFSLPNEFVSIDFETLYSQRVSACSIGMVKYKEGKIIDKYYSLIKPPFDYTGKKGFELTKIHGISKEELVNEKTFAELLPDIERFVGEMPLVAHNASVEKGCIRDCCAYYNINTKLDYQHIYDTLPLSKQAEEKVGLKAEGQGTHTLDVVCKRFGVDVKNHHNALDDAEMCGDLMVVFYQILKEDKSMQSLSLKPTPQNNNNKEIPKQKNNYTTAIKVTSSDTETDVNNKGCLGILIVFIISLIGIAMI